MRFHQHLDETFSYTEELNSLDKFLSLLDPDIVEQAFEVSGVATLRRRRLPLEAVVLLVIGMSLYRNETVWDIASKLDISLPGKKLLVAPSALVQARQRLGYEAVRQVFEALSQRTFETKSFEQWCGLNLLAVDGVVYRAQDTHENIEAFGCEKNVHGESPYPQIRMCCLMEVSSHLLLASEFDARHVGEMKLAERLLKHVPANSLTLFDRGYYSLGLLNLWHQSADNAHWMLPARKDLQYEVIHQLSEHDAVVTLPTSPQARKKFCDLPDKITARLTSYQVNGKQYRVLSSLTDPLRYPYDELTEVYTQRWEIELGFKEMKQGLHQAKHALRSKKPDMVKQELWGLLLAYNLVRMVMIDATEDTPDLTPTRLSFTLSMRQVVTFFITVTTRSASKLPEHYAYLLDTLRLCVLPDKRPDRVYPRAVRAKPSKYPKKKNASQLN
ncbi:IS4 family transposase [Aestuariibacter sp. AA17]|uniref:IS4 family transposase n=1 Tax=Fluctibacter corallii TaxID=2984329 RepID=A0ABT3AEN9_9ALTE|nr:IS4 family transposase [Aestuariibacter sp. AA17]MCV2886696.1 IS4 family transposase [Aestuariibacter sp. AA17]